MKKKLRVLIGCEFSGVVRSAFEDRGWDAWSCDYLQSELPGQHRQGDVLNFMRAYSWNLAIFHPPCTYLCNSGAKHLYNGMKKENGVNPERWEAMEAGAKFFKKLLNSAIKHIAIENPIMLGYARKIIGCGPTQVVQPWWFGHGEIKATCLWLKNLPPLEPTKVVHGRDPRVHFMSPGPNRWKERSRTLPGLAKAMASQWGSYIENLNK